MEIVCCSIPHSQPLSVVSTRHPASTGAKALHLSSIRAPSSPLFGNINPPANVPYHTRFTPPRSVPAPHNHDPSQQLAVFLEVEGVLMDVYRLGNRRAFNAAFQKLGLDCANWTEPIYSDLLRRSSSDEEKMLILFFNRIGWPSSLPTSEKGTFVKNVLQEKKIALDELVMTKCLPLRPGVKDFIDDACNQGFPVVLLTAYSKSGDKIARSIIEKLGNERLSKVKIIGNEEVEQSFVGQLILGKGMPSDLGEQLAKDAGNAASTEKQRVAAKVASLLNLSVDVGMGSAESLQRMAALLRAGAELLGFPVYNCVLIAGSQSAAAGADQIGMPYFILRTSLTARSEFPSANATMDGFGGADLTVSKILRKRWS